MSETSAAKSLFHESRRPYLLRKLHSLSGVMPVGFFMCFHLFENAKAMKGRAPFDEAVAGIGSTPALWAAEIGVILIPLLFHAGYGVAIVLRGKPNVGYYTYSRNWMYLLQRITGVLALLFIGWHLWEYRVQKLLGNLAPEQFYPQLCANMSMTMGGVPVIALVYILGIAACVFHFANGLWGFAFSWGLTVSRRSQQMMAGVVGAIGLAVFLLGASTAIYFATGSRYPDSLWEKVMGASDVKGGTHTCADVALK